jgi:transposase-like protein
LAGSNGIRLKPGQDLLLLPEVLLILKDLSVVFHGVGPIGLDGRVRGLSATGAGGSGLRLSWADGIHFTIRLEDERLCALVLIGVRPDGPKEVVALEDGYRESAESWRAVLRDLKRRGMRAPVLAIGDGALGFWAAVREVWPETGEQRCWVHRIVNVLDKLPKSLQPRAKQALHAMPYAETRTACEREIRRFTAEYVAKFPRRWPRSRRTKNGC